MPERLRNTDIRMRISALFAIVFEIFSINIRGFLFLDSELLAAKDAPEGSLSSHLLLMLIRK